MKNFAIVLLIVAAVGYYFGIDFTDFLPSVPSSEAAKERAPHAAAAGERAPAATPQPISTAARNDDGSLANRWKP